ncbi:SUMF1/EgtB/PvdO family nonheme iron enzyme, partial [bacterium]|nr:SUMF1/EgtB/PvdO family nonheme iron enzyme [bacterium]
MMNSILVPIRCAALTAVLLATAVLASAATLTVPGDLDVASGTHVEKMRVTTADSGFAIISPGSFEMGSPDDELGRDDDELQHTVTLTTPFAIQATEVTNQQYADLAQWAYDNDYCTVPFPGHWIMDQLDGSSAGLFEFGGFQNAISFSDGEFSVEAGKEDHPVIYATWYGAAAYCDWLSLQEGLPRAYDHATWECNGGDPYGAVGYRLPTEAEWEYACRAGSETAFANGPITDIHCDDPVLDEIGWYCDGASIPVATLIANDWGLYDMHGNVWEWCNDWFSEYEDDETDPIGPPSGSMRIARGGGFGNQAQGNRSATRTSRSPSHHGHYWGFRPAKSAAGADEVSVVGPDDCLSAANPCGDATVSFERDNTDPLRGLSVTFTLSEELALCSGDPESDIAALSGPGAMFEGYGNVVQEVIDNGGGSYTVDIVLTGNPCGPTTGGDVFTIALTAAEGSSGDVTGQITLDAVAARDCDAQPLPAVAGPPVDVTIDGTPPAPITDLGVALGADGATAGTKLVEMAWTAPGDPEAETIEVWRHGYGDHPEYDDGTGAPASLPVSEDNGWTLVTVLAAAAASYSDDPGTRDFWSYAVKSVDACGNASAVAVEEIAGGVLNYHLGDVVDPADAALAGDNLVDMADISRLGAGYGTADGDSEYLNILDIGPTADLSALSLPTTDDLVDFEDLMVMATNFGMVGRMVPADILAASGNAIQVDVASTGPRPGTVTAHITVRGDGRIQGLSVPLVWNADAVKPVAMSVGDLIAAQGGHGIVLSPEPGTVDAALLGVRERGHGIRGEGVLATVVFEVIGEGEPRIAAGEITARDAGNKPLVLGAAGEGAALASAEGTTLPAQTALNPNHPNPFNPSTTLSFSLERAGRVRLGIYDVRGRLVASLVDGPMAGGEHAVVWHGRDDAGQTVSSGTYFVRMVTADRSQTRTIT